MIVELVLQLISILWLIEPLAGAAPSMAKPNCQDFCNNVTIPYPFGIGKGCYHNEWYEITCIQSFKPHKLFLRKLKLEVLNINFASTYNTSSVSSFPSVIVNSSIDSSCKHGDDGRSLWTSFDLRGSPFRFSSSNELRVIGCGNALLSNQSGNILAGCTSICKNITTTKGCYGINCCQVEIPSYLDIYNVSTTADAAPENCTYAFLSNQDYVPNEGKFSTAVDIRDTEHAPVALEWLIERPDIVTGHKSSIDYDCSSTTYGVDGEQYYLCSCGSSHEGNPYIRNGCKVIHECALCKGRCYVNYEQPAGSYFCDEYHNRMPIKEIVLGVSIGGGSLFLLLGSFGLFKVIRKVRNTKRKAKFFKRNGGLLLQQQILSTKEGAIEKTKMFTSKELEKATENFNKNRILGQGGQGTVYKGMLTDGRIVAIKKSKIVDESQLEQFINEVVILSQINHRNVVKLLGCCLETEVPLLVYEFIPNGTLFQLIHDQNEEFPFSWDMRLQIAIEVAGAIAYLHSAASIPIYHRDIKSTNILLDDKYRAKVADFGTSRSISIEKTHLTTLVQGTFGYLDPEYFQSSQFTEKSDVYSFGVVLVELLTGQKPISSTRLEDKSLATHFILSLKEGRLFDILDGRVIMEGRKEEIMMIANIAKQCLNLSGKKRPTMKEVAMELEESRRCQMPSSTVQKNFQEGDCIIELSGPFDGASASRSSHLDYTGDFSLDVHPLLYNTV